MSFKPNSWTRLSRQNVALEPPSKNAQVVICLVPPSQLILTGTTLKHTLGRLAANGTNCHRTVGTCSCSLANWKGSALLYRIYYCLCLVTLMFSDRLSHVISTSTTLKSVMTGSLCTVSINILSWMYQIVVILPTSRHSAGETSGTLIGTVAFCETRSTKLVRSYVLKVVTQRGTSEDSAPPSALNIEHTLEQLLVARLSSADSGQFQWPMLLLWTGNPTFPY